MWTSKRRLFCADTVSICLHPLLDAIKTLSSLFNSFGTFFSPERLKLTLMHTHTYFRIMTMAYAMTLAVIMVSILKCLSICFSYLFRGIVSFTATIVCHSNQFVQSKAYDTHFEPLFSYVLSPPFHTFQTIC